MGQPSKYLYTTGPGDYWQQVTPVVYVDLYSDPLQQGTDDSWLNNWLCLGS